MATNCWHQQSVSAGWPCAHLVAVQEQGCPGPGRSRIPTGAAIKGLQEACMTQLLPVDPPSDNICRGAQAGV